MRVEMSAISKEEGAERLNQWLTDALFDGWGLERQAKPFAEWVGVKHDHVHHQLEAWDRIENDTKGYNCCDAKEFRAIGMIAFENLCRIQKINPKVLLAAWPDLPVYALGRWVTQPLRNNTSLLSFAQFGKEDYTVAPWIAAGLTVNEANQAIANAIYDMMCVETDFEIHPPLWHGARCAIGEMGVGGYNLDEAPDRYSKYTGEIELNGELEEFQVDLIQLSDAVTDWYYLALEPTPIGKCRPAAPRHSWHNKMRILMAWLATYSDVQSWAVAEAKAAALAASPLQGENMEVAEAAGLWKTIRPNVPPEPRTPSNQRLQVPEAPPPLQPKPKPAHWTDRVSYSD